MSVTARQVKNKRTSDGGSTSRAGTVYDVFIRYKTAEGYKTYGKRGFLTKSEAIDHEAEMRTKLTNPGYEPIKAADAKQTVQEYLESWVEVHGKANLRPSTFSSYKSHIKNHIVPYIGNVPLKKVTPAMIDNMLKQLSEKGLSVSTCRYAQRILSVAFEAARKYRYIEGNPARDILTKFGKEAKTPDPYTVEQMQHLMALGSGNEWQMIFVLSGLYGLRRNEVLGLRWDNVDLKNRQFSITEQLPFKVPPKTTVITEMAPTKSQGRTLPITEVTLSFFQKQLSLQQKQKELSELSGQPYYDNRLVIYRQYLSGDDAGLEALMKKYGDPLTLYIDGYLHDVHEAEELMLDVFAYLFTKKPRIRDGGFKAYLYKAARHMALRHKSKRKPLFSLDALTGEPDGRLLAEEVIRTEERNRILHFCMSEMNPDYREVLYLTYFEDMSYAQAAEVTGKTVKQITNMVYRGKESLRRLLEREGITNAES